jgi:hypothetical protein
MSMPLPHVDAESKKKGGVSATVFVHAFIDPKEIADEIMVGDVVYVDKSASQMRRSSDDSNLPEICLSTNENAVPFGVVGQGELVTAVRDVSYIAIVSQGPCLVATNLLYGSPVPGSSVWVGSSDGIPAALIVFDMPYSQISIK